MVFASSGGTDNQALRDIKDILQESKKQSKYMLWLTIAVVVLTALQLIFLLIDLTLT